MKLAAALTIVACCLPLPAQAQSLSPQDALAKARAVYRSHRPPPPYEIYTIRREQRTADGMPDFEWSYEYRVWCRTADGAALGRRIFRGEPGRLEFMRPAFDEARDPGPATADLFELGPRRPPPVPVPIALPLIGSVNAAYEAEYQAASLERQGDELHLRLRPLRDPRRNRLRDLWLDAATFEIRKAVVVDRLFVIGGPVYEELDTITMGRSGGYPVIAHIHARAEFDPDSGDGLDVDYTIGDVRFPASLPDWYFEPASYGAHVAQAPF